MLPGDRDGKRNGFFLCSCGIGNENRSKIDKKTSHLYQLKALIANASTGKNVFSSASHLYQPKALTTNASTGKNVSGSASHLYQAKALIKNASIEKNISSLASHLYHLSLFFPNAANAEKKQPFAPIPSLPKSLR